MRPYPCRLYSEENALLSGYCTVSSSLISIWSAVTEPLLEPLSLMGGPSTADTSTPVPMKGPSFPVWRSVLSGPYLAPGLSQPRLMLRRYPARGGRLKASLSASTR
ncbi:hypothetical protein EGW08_017991 [Elysia chlorotica]|uniref:Uncharacterized protein n=1 Tax=Elysia chlorotica TaxID=188477 RepID=A0A3S0ZC23_ELYCH|nr:hypothetical protein EGW08_017991 [Elysia chlorotica]